MGLVGNLFFGLKAALAVAFVAVWAIVSVAPPLTLMPPTDSSMKLLLRQQTFHVDDGHGIHPTAATILNLTGSRNEPNDLMNRISALPSTIQHVLVFVGGSLPAPDVRRLTAFVRNLSSPTVHFASSSLPTIATLGRLSNGSIPTALIETPNASAILPQLRPLGPIAPPLCRWALRSGFLPRYVGARGVIFETMAAAKEAAPALRASGVWVAAFSDGELPEAALLKISTIVTNLEAFDDF